MPGLIGSQGIRPGALNMNRVFRALRYRTEQAQTVTYHRPPIYTTDAYGVPNGDSILDRRTSITGFTSYHKTSRHSELSNINEMEIT